MSFPCTNSYLRYFEAKHMSQPEVLKAIEDEGVEVFETFTTDSGETRFCHQHTQDAFDKWLTENPESGRDIRKDFISELAECVKIRRDITLYGKMPGLDGPVTRRNTQAETLYDAAARDAIGVLLSMTDDREGNRAGWRLTTPEGKVIPFCNPNDKEYMESPGLIVMFHEEINT